MTLPYERFNALRQVPEALLELTRPGARLKKREVREKVRWLLRHYPLPHELVEIASQTPLLRLTRSLG